MKRNALKVAAAVTMVCMLLLQGCADTQQVWGTNPPAFVPKTVNEALRALHHTQALDAGWHGFGMFSSVTLHRRGYTVLEGKFDEQVLQVVTNVGPDGTTFEFPDNPDLPPQKAVFDIPSLAANKARLGGSATVKIHGRSYHARIFEFVSRVDEPPDGELITTHRFWLAAGIPTGVVRHDAIQIESDYAGNRVVLATTTRRLTDLDVSLNVGGKTLQCYCYDEKMRLRGGEIQRSRFCENPTIPGGTALYQEVGTKDGKQISRLDVDVTTFESHPLPR